MINIAARLRIYLRISALVNINAYRIDNGHGISRFMYAPDITQWASAVVVLPLIRRTADRVVADLAWRVK